LTERERKNVPPKIAPSHDPLPAPTEPSDEVEGEDVEAFADPFPGLLRKLLESGKDIDGFTSNLRRDLNEAAPQMIRRWSELPDLDLTAGSHVSLLQEARELYVHGHFYSCVAMCGITSERIMKDMLREHFVIRKDDESTTEIPEEAVPELDRFELSAIAKLLTKAALLETSVKEAVLDLAELRNKYAHGSGKNPRTDALKALGLLHAIIEKTVSLFKDHDRFGSAPQKDILEGATGAFGREPTNPIPGDYREYCKQLRCPQNHPYHFKRRHSVGPSGPDHHYIDHVSLRCFGGESALDLYFDIYHAGISGNLPEGLGRGPAEGKRHPSSPAPLGDY